MRFNQSGLKFSTFQASVISLALAIVYLGRVAKTGKARKGKLTTCKPRSLDEAKILQTYFRPTSMLCMYQYGNADEASNDEPIIVASSPLIMRIKRQEYQLRIRGQVVAEF